MTEQLIDFVSGCGYGFSSVIIGQPLDTIKTRMQGLPSTTASSQASSVAKNLFVKEGIQGLYRGGVPLLIGGSFMRSAQFGVNGSVARYLKDNYASPEMSSSQQQQPFWHVVVAGISGGLARGVVEVPTDFFKTRRQVEHMNWTYKEMLDGSGVTMIRNGGLFAMFMIYIDGTNILCQRGYIPKLIMTDDHTQLSSFARGAICANLAWLTVWPFDVVKTQRQSGNYSSNTSTIGLLSTNLQTGRLFRGLVPGLVRAAITNGSSMVLYDYIHNLLTEKLLDTR